MSTNLRTGAELRSIAPKLASEIRELLHDGAVKPSGASPDGIALYDKEAVLIAADVRACERLLASRGVGARSIMGRAEQYRSASKELGL